MTSIQKTYACRQDLGTEKPFNTKKLWAGGLVFLFLTVGVFWYQFVCHEPCKLMMLWDQLRWEYLFLMIIFLPADTLAGSLRIWVVSRTNDPAAHQRKYDAAQ